MDQHADKDKIGEELAAQRFQMLEDIAKELTGDVVFPTCFDTVLRLRKELQNPNLSIADIAHIVSVEPLIAAKLIRLANSAVYAAHGRQVLDLPSAINRLGLNIVRATALAIAMTQILHAKDMAAYSHVARSLWDHSIRSAVGARLLAHTYTRINPEEALLAGLVHDLGASYMLYRATQYPELRERPDTVKHLIMQWHEGIGVTLLETLGLPEEIVQASVDHDHPRSVPDIPKTLADIVYVSNILAGAHYEWLYQDFDPQATAFTSIHEKYSGILPELEVLAREMRSALA